MYTKQTWENRNVATPNDFTLTKSGGGALGSGDIVTIEANPGTITNAGTSILATYMNNIESLYIITRFFLEITVF